MGEQSWNPALYDDRHRFVTKYGEALLSLLDPQPGERVLDLGCGTGHLTQKIAQAGARAVGLDRSAEMLAQARMNYPALDFIEGDGADFHFDKPFDAVFSNAALHWMLDPARVIACVWDALKPGGRFVGELGGKGNVARLIDGAFEALAVFGQPMPERLPWYFPSAGEYATLLERQRFRVAYMTHFDRPTPLEGDDALANYLRMYIPQFLDALPLEQLPHFFTEVEQRLRPSLYRGGSWILDFVRLRFAAVKPPIHT